MWKNAEMDVSLCSIWGFDKARDTKVKEDEKGFSLIFNRHLFFFLIIIIIM